MSKDTNDSAGTVGVLNVGAGDTKLSFDKSNPQERIRAARIVRDMIRRGYALLIEVEGKYVRATDFDENTCEYIIADFDPEIAAVADQRERDDATQQTQPQPRTTPTPAPPTRRGRPRKVDASRARAVAVAPSAGG